MSLDNQYRAELTALTHKYFNMASAHIGKTEALGESLRKAVTASLSKAKTDEAEIPGHEARPEKFGEFKNHEFVIMMTDVRDSTGIINAPNGVIHMFLMFYVYAGVVAKIVDSYQGTSTEFLGDGVLNLFDIKEHGQDDALLMAMTAARAIMSARVEVLNPFFSSVGLPTLNMGIGIDHGITIVTRFGYRGDTDLKAFGRPAYNASKLSKGMNEIIVSTESQKVWPSGPGGTVNFLPTMVGELYCYVASKTR